MDQHGIRGALVRGGTSKGLFVLERELPDDEEERDAALLSIYGSPDPRQIDGIGGATTTTSKMMIVGEPRRPDAEVSYTFGQVAIEEAEIDYDGNCGNMTFGVGAFAVDEGLVPVDAADEAVTVRLHNTNTNTLLDQTIPLVDGRAATKGDFKVHGVPGTGARVETAFLDPGGAFTGELFPLGEPTVELNVDGESVEVSVVDVTTPVVFVHAATLGIDGTELPGDLERDDDFLPRLERIRGEVCVRLGLVETAEESATVSPNYPKFAVVRSPTDYRTSDGDTVRADEIDLVARVSSMPVMHPVYAVTSASCTAAAVHLPGTIPHEVATADDEAVTIGHPKGTMTVRAEVDVDVGSNGDGDGEGDGEDGGPTVRSVTVGRTQRRLMEAVAFY